MTVERMIELLEIEKECVLRNASGECNRYCSGCDLLQDDTELHEMYTEVIALLKAQEPVKPVVDIDTWKCGNCGHTLEHQQLLGDNVLLHEQYNYCPECGRAVKWE